MRILGFSETGLKIGIKDRSHKYLLVVCAQCNQPRWVSLRDTQKAKFTNICLHCRRRNQTLSNNPNWRGGITNLNGYIRHYEPTHPRAAKSSYVYEHLLIWEQVHNKALPQGWVIHHLNGIKSDNRPENLVALPNKKHMSVLAEKSKRIRALEVKVKLLERALEANQMIFKLEEN